MNKVFLFDVDGTLSYNGIIPQSALLALETLRKNGYKVMLATGRCLAQLNDILANIKIDGAIICNGSYAFLDEKIIFDSPISKEVLIKLFPYLQKKNIGSAYLGIDFFKTTSKIENLQLLSYAFSIKLPEFNDEMYKKNKVYSLGIYTKNDISRIVEKCQELKFVKVAAGVYDVFNKGVSKASAVNILKNNYEVYAFGDNDNDIEMLQAANFSFAMKNGSENAKRSAKYIADNALNDGIYKALKEFKLI